MEGRPNPQHRRSWDSFTELDHTGNTLPIYDPSQGVDSILQVLQLQNLNIGAPGRGPNPSQYPPSPRSNNDPLTPGTPVTLSRPPSYLHDSSLPPIIGDLPPVPQVPQQYQYANIQSQWANQPGQAPPPTTLAQQTRYQQHPQHYQGGPSSQIPAQPQSPSSLPLQSISQMTHSQPPSGQPQFQVQPQPHRMVMQHQPYGQTPGGSQAMSFYNSAVGGTRKYGRALPPEPMGGSGAEVTGQTSRRELQSSNSSTATSYGVVNHNYSIVPEPQPHERERTYSSSYAPQLPNYEPQFAGNPVPYRSSSRNGQISYPSQAQQSLPPRSFAAQQYGQQPQSYAPMQHAYTTQPPPVPSVPQQYLQEQPQQQQVRSAHVAEPQLQQSYASPPGTMQPTIQAQGYSTLQSSTVPPTPPKDLHLYNPQAQLPRNPSLITAQPSASDQPLAIQTQPDPEPILQPNGTVSSPYDTWPPPSVEVLPPSPETQRAPPRPQEALLQQNVQVQQQPPLVQPGFVQPHMHEEHSAPVRKGVLSPVSEEQEDIRDNLIPEMGRNDYAQTNTIQSPSTNTNADTFVGTYQIDEEGDTYSEYQRPEPGERVYAPQYAPTEVDIEEEEEEEIDSDYEDRIQKARSRKKLQAVLGETFGPAAETPPRAASTVFSSGASRKSTPSVHSNKTVHSTNNARSVPSRSPRDSSFGEQSTTSLPLPPPLPLPAPTPRIALSADDRNKMMRRSKKMQAMLGESTSNLSGDSSSPSIGSPMPMPPPTARSDMTNMSGGSEAVSQETHYSSAASSLNMKRFRRQSSSSSIDRPHRSSSIADHNPPPLPTQSVASSSSPLSPVREYSGGRVLTQALNKLSRLKPKSQASISRSQSSAFRSQPPPRSSSVAPGENKRTWNSMPNASREYVGSLYTNSAAAKSATSLISTGTMAVGTS
ncbi:hypothetical protein BT69DRAFT_1277333 [Atractiella rhizophila]|nr:hypothetical protein BT69DRAFT_1277333 [Atractiella rhizophila]